MQEFSLKVTHRKIEDMLNRSYEAFKQSEGMSDRFSYEFPLRVQMFCYEIWTDLLSFERNDPDGFARAIAIKALIHRLIEFNRHLDEYLIPKVLVYAEKNHIPFVEGDARDMRKRWRPTFKQLEKWKKIRNKATGHYDPDAAEVVALLESIDVFEVQKATSDFIEYSIALTNKFTGSRY